MALQRLKEYLEKFRITTEKQRYVIIIKKQQKRP
jgi:hypothetical protein